MLNFTEVKAKIAEIAGIDASKVAIGFLTQTYEVSFTADLDEEITRDKAMDIVSAIADAVVRTPKYIGYDEKSVVVVFHM